MTFKDFYDDFRLEFSALATRVDQEHIQLWDDVSHETAFAWFESVAKVINSDMQQEISSSEYKDVFEYFRSNYLLGNDKIKECIDVSFVENLFWEVQPKNANAYWSILPTLLKNLYLEFHSREPV